MASYEYTDFDDDNQDILAVLARGDVEITFIQVPDNTTTKDFTCLSWHDEKMLIGLTAGYLEGYVKETISDLVVRAIRDCDSEEEATIRAHQVSTQYFSDMLSQVLAEVIMTSTPSDSSLDGALQRILEEN